MIDFGPLLSQPLMFLFGAGAQFGIFFAICVAVLLGFDIVDAAAIGMIGAADGPTSILVSQILHSKYVGPIAVAAYSYMALVPIVQPFAIRLVTTKKERKIRMEYNPGSVSKSMRIAFPIVVTFLVGLISPQSVAFVVFLMFGNLIRECDVLNTLSDTAQNVLSNLITLLLGITISFSMRAEAFANSDRPVKIYSLDVIISVGYRVKSKRGIEFRRWANSVLKQYILKGYAVNHNRINQLGEVIRIMRRTENSLDSKQVLSVIEKYNTALELLDSYDHQTMQHRQYLSILWWC